MAPKTETPVADPEPAAPAAEPEVQAPPEPAAQQPESESGTEQASGVEQLKVFLGGIKTPEALESVLGMMNPEVRSQTASFKDERGRGRQSGRVEAENQRRLRERDEEEHRSNVTRRDEALTALSGNEPTDVASHAKKLRAAAADVRDTELKQEAVRVFESLPIFERYGDAEIDRLERVGGQDYARWLRGHIETSLDVARREGIAEGVEQEKTRAAADRSLEQELESPERGETPPRLPAGGPASGSTFEQLETLVANGTATDDQTAQYEAECRRLGFL